MGRRKKNPDIQLYYAVVHGNLKRIKHLVYNEGVSVNHVFMDGSFPLHVAAERGFVEIVTFLLSMKASTDMKNQHGQTPLMLGIGYPPIVKVLFVVPQCQGHTRPLLGHSRQFIERHHSTNLYL